LKSFQNIFYNTALNSLHEDKPGVDYNLV